MAADPLVCLLLSPFSPSLSWRLPRVPPPTKSLPKKEILAGLELDLYQAFPVNQLGQLLANLQFGRKYRLLLAADYDNVTPGILHRGFRRLGLKHLDQRADVSLPRQAALSRRFRPSALRFVRGLPASSLAGLPGRLRNAHPSPQLRDKNPSQSSRLLEAAQTVHALGFPKPACRHLTTIYLKFLPLHDWIQPPLSQVSEESVYASAKLHASWLDCIKTAQFFSLHRFSDHWIPSAVWRLY